MLRIANEEEFLEAFRPIDRDHVRLPPEMTFPLIVRNYMAWVEPSGHRTFLVFEEASKRSPRGIVFNRPHASADQPAAMCDWCHSVRGRGAVGLLTATVSPHRRIGLTLCRDLTCKEKIEGIPSANDLRESMPTDMKMRRLVEQMSEFARRNLF